MAKQAPRIPLNIATSINPDGQTIPAAILLDEGERVFIEKVLSIRDMSYIRPGATGTRFKCKIGKMERYIYHAAEEWYVEQ